MAAVQLTVVNRDGVLQLHNPGSGAVQVRLLDLFGKELHATLLPAGGSAAWGWTELGARMVFVVSRDGGGRVGVQRVVGAMAR